MPPTSSPRRPTQKPALVVKRSPIQGSGGFASRPIKRGERVIEYLGERITHDEADRRYDDDGMSRHHTFLFSVDDAICIDASVDGNDARFINHSCEPNAKADERGGRIFIVATRGIAAGEEIFYDYAYIVDERTTYKEALRLYPCRCGAEGCRGTLADVPKPKAPAKRAKKSAKKSATRNVRKAPTKTGATKRAKSASPRKRSKSLR